MNYRLMRVLLFFDLPVVEKEEKREYTRFRKFLLKDGYEMLQYSVYSRISANKDAANKHIDRAIINAPKSGAIRAVILTEKQYEEMIIVLGSLTKQERKVTNNRLLIM
ncbi:CRISPR-associated endonuclease Cas2 [Clostridium sp. M14]|uniref:CRISPR-associated endonuclease Cas2 n=1 Tax=Clostridium sp. M14 TaxID=2716311 RepID=UPI00191D811C|nr:CRISPR-associated endonuclease Cas2 [Clostridium sp. M14]MBZ9692412.1 CRISPR-associated endonuclease Cas2 [Clostridium sp. M14]